MLSVARTSWSTGRRLLLKTPPNPALESGSALGRHFGIAKGPSSTPGQQSTGSLLDTEGHPRPSKHRDVLVARHVGTRSVEKPPVASAQPAWRPANGASRLRSFTDCALTPALACNPQVSHQPLEARLVAIVLFSSG
jgi:hypothetical protein